MRQRRGWNQIVVALEMNMILLDSGVDDGYFYPEARCEKVSLFDSELG